MTPLQRLMNAIPAMLNAQTERGDRIAPAPDRPPVFIRTNWCFVEADEALQKATILSTKIKEARLANDVPRAADLTTQMRETLWQALEMAKDAERQFQLEGGQ